MGWDLRTEHDTSAEADEGSLDLTRRHSRLANDRCSDTAHAIDEIFLRPSHQADFLADPGHHTPEHM